MKPKLAADVTKKELQLRPLVRHLKIEVDAGGCNIKYMKAMGHPSYVEDGWTTASISWARWLSKSVDGQYAVKFLYAASSMSLRSLELVNWPCPDPNILRMLCSFEKLETLVVSGDCNVRQRGPDPEYCLNLNTLKQNVIDFPSLTHLDMINLNHGCRAAVTTVPSQEMLPHVRSLAFSTSIEWINYEQGLSKCPSQLEKFHLRTNFLNDDLLGKIAARCKSLQELRVRHECYGLPYQELQTPKVTIAGLQDLLSNSPHLKVVHISGLFVKAVSPAEWCDVLQAKQLKEIHLPVVSEEITRMVENQDGLEVLSFEYDSVLSSFKELYRPTREGTQLQVCQNTCICVGGRPGTNSR